MKMLISNIYSAVFPCLFTTAIFGLSSIYPTVQNRTIKLINYTTLKIVNLFHLIAFTYSLHIAINDTADTQLHSNYASGVSKIGIVFLFLSQIGAAYASYIINVTQSGKIKLCLENIAKIDKTFNDLGINMNYEKHFFYELSVILLGVSILLLCGCASYVNMKDNIFEGSSISNIFFLWPPLIPFLLQSSFVFFVHLLHDRFYLVNKLLNKVTDTKTNNETDLKNLNHRLKCIELLMEIHDALTDTGNKLNFGFTLQIVFCFAGLFLNIVFSTFYLYYETLVGIYSQNTVI